MALVELNIAGRNYKIACENGEEDRLFKLAKHVDDKAKELLSVLGHVSEPLLLVMTCLQIADELGDSQNKIEALKLEKNNVSPQNQELEHQIAKEFDEKMAGKVNNLAEKIYLIAQNLEKI